MSPKGGGEQTGDRSLTRPSICHAIDPMHRS